jgi:hypothetical protein
MNMRYVLAILSAIAVHAVSSDQKRRNDSRPGFVLKFPGVAFAWELHNRPDPIDRAKGGDLNVYLVVDDLGPGGGVWREADVEPADLETVILDLLDGQYRNSVWSAFDSRAGRRISRPMSPKSYAAAVTCKCAICHRAFRPSSGGG